MPSNSPPAPQVPITPSASFFHDRNDGVLITNDEGGGGRNNPLSTSGDVETLSSRPIDSHISEQNSISSIEMPTFANRTVSSGMLYNF